MSEVQRLIQVILPMAGSGLRFQQAGYSTPKPLLSIHGRHMFEVVLRNLVSPWVKSFTLVSRKEWELSLRTEAISQELGLPITLIELESPTRGAAETVLVAAERVDPDLPVVTANSDQYVDAPLHGFYQVVASGAWDGVILTMKDNDPKWSYAATDHLGCVSRVEEKAVISSDATVGIYGFRDGRTMTSAIGRMMDAGDTVNGEFYIAPAYNFIVADGGRVAIEDLGPINEVMYGMGIPHDYEEFLRSPASLRSASTHPDIR